MAEGHMDADVYTAAQRRRVYTQIEANNILRRTLNDDNNVVHIAAKSGNTKFIQGALNQHGEYHCKLLCQSNIKNETPLHLAAQYGHLETVQTLLRAHTITPNGDELKRDCWMEMDALGDTPLHKALRNGHDEIAVLLLAWNHNLVSVENSRNESVAYLAAENMCSNFLYRILRLREEHHVSFSTPHEWLFLYSARKLPENLIRKLLKSMKGHLANDGLVLYWKSLIHGAIMENRLTIVKVMLEVDSSLACVVGIHDCLPLHLAFKQGLLDMIKIILQKSPQSIETRDINGKTALHHASMDGDFLERCCTSIDLTMDLLINEVDNEGNTALHIALLSSELDAAYQLLSCRGCNWRLRNNAGQNPLELCSLIQEISIKSPVYQLLVDLERVKLRPGLRKWEQILRSLYVIDLTEMEDKELRKWLDKIGVAAALLLSINFTTSFSVPGGYSSSGYPNLTNHILFVVFRILNIISFGANVLILLYCTFGFRKRGGQKQKLTCISIRLIQFSLLASIFAYLCGTFAISTGLVTMGYAYLGMFIAAVIVFELYHASPSLEGHKNIWQFRSR